MARSLCVILLLFFVSFFVSWTFVGPLLCVWIKSLKNHNKIPKSWKRKGNPKRYNWRDNAIHEKFVNLWLSHLIFAGWTGVATRSFFSWVLKLRHQVILVENSLIMFAGCTGVGLIIYGFWTMCKRRMKQSPARQTSISSHRAVTETRWLLIKQMKDRTRIENGGSSCNTEAHDNHSYLQANWNKKSNPVCTVNDVISRGA